GHGPSYRSPTVARQAEAACAKRARVRWPAVAVLVLLAAPAGRAAPPPWQRTETRQPCTHFDLFRQPFFGDLHIHTRFSADAYIFGTRVTPQDSYAFATGTPILLADDNEMQTRSTRID